MEPSTKPLIHLPINYLIHSFNDFLCNPITYNIPMLASNYGIKLSTIFHFLSSIIAQRSSSTTSFCLWHSNRGLRLWSQHKRTLSRNWPPSAMGTPGEFSEHSSPRPPPPTSSGTRRLILRIDVKNAFNVFNYKRHLFFMLSLNFLVHKIFKFC